MPDELLRRLQAASSAIAGLRDLADFLEQNPRVPAPPRTDVLVFPAEASDGEMFAEIDTIAELIGSTASDADSPRGHYSAVRDFGPVQYRAVAIPYSAREKRGRIAMLVNLILGSVALMGAAFAGGLLVVIIGIRRGDHGKRLTGDPAAIPRRSPAVADRLARLRLPSDTGEDR